MDGGHVWEFMDGRWVGWFGCLYVQTHELSFASCGLWLMSQSPRYGRNVGFQLNHETACSCLLWSPLVFAFLAGFREQKKMSNDS